MDAGSLLEAQRLAGVYTDPNNHFNDLVPETMVRLPFATGAKRGKYLLAFATGTDGCWHQS